MASDSDGNPSQEKSVHPEDGQNVPGPSNLKQRTKSEDHQEKPKKTVHFSSKTAFEKLAYAPRKKYESSEDYFVELRQWLHQVFFWQSVSSAFPYFLMCQQLGQAPPVSPAAAGPESSAGAQTTDQTAASGSQQFSSGNINQAGVEQAPGVNQVNFPQFPVPPSFNFGHPVPFQQFPYPYPPQFMRPQTQQQPVQHPRREPVQDGIEVRIPAFWKRIIAEFIDFLILFFVKIVVTYFAVDFFNIIDLDNFDVFQKDMKIAYKTFIQITQDIVILELIHRVVVCAFETYWLSGGQNGRTGGSTPGKSIMGLRVVRCDSSVTVGAAGDGGGGELVVVRPGTNLGLGVSFIRAAIKNLVLALLIPTSFAFIFFPHNRTGYDMICNTIVVEEPILPHHQHQD